jgi:2-polyprenyl-6-methoxyphenol hydroxylase-like FAD-dependent oxidoreductase
VRIAVLGAGPAGLLFAALARRRNPAWTIEVFDQNPEGATYGFGVVFSAGALAFLERDAPGLLPPLAAAMESWPMQRIVHRGERVDIDGNGFSAIARLRLLEILGGLCADAGVSVRWGRAVGSLAELGAADLVVGADGWNSIVRRSLAGAFRPGAETLTNRFVWYGTAQPFECLTLTFRESADGAFVAHHYRYAPDMSTFIVECDDATWARAGFAAMTDAQSRAYCERVFCDDLGGHALVSNKSLWRQFPLVSNRSWSARAGAGHAVLIGDALRTVHFSIGSGTRLAFEDAIALDRAFGEAGADVPAALAAFERERRPVVEKLLAAAHASSGWYERFAGRMSLDPVALAYDYMTRSGRMSAERLAQIAPKFMKRLGEARGS